MPDCPTCGDSFDTERGLGVHHSAAHGERLPNRECARCGAAFHCEYEKKYCSNECLEASVSFAGENNPNYRGGKESTTCEICDSQFDYYPSEKPGRYCKTCVENEEWREVPVVRGQHHPRWAGGSKELECDVCGRIVFRRPSFPDDKHVFCSDECQYKWLSDAFAGDGHPNWKGGGDANYGQGWRRIRRLALERDDYRCRICGTTAADLGRNPDVHHIVPVREFVEEPALTERDAHHLENVISLCIGCHRRAEFGHISRERLRLLV